MPVPKEIGHGCPCQFPHNTVEILLREFANETRNLVLPLRRGRNMAQMTNRRTNYSRERASKKEVAKCFIILGTQKAFCIRNDSPICKFVHPKNKTMPWNKLKKLNKLMPSNLRMMT